MSTEKVKQLIVRMPEDLHKWLKENVKDVSINDFMIDLLKAHIESIKPKEAEQPEPTVTPESKRLLRMRNQFFITHDKDEELKQAWWELESQLDPDRDFGHVDDEKNFESAKTKLGNYWNEYFEPMQKLTNDELWIFYYMIEKQREQRQHEDTERRCGGDPDEVVFKDWTRLDIHIKFDKKTPVTVKWVASKLGLSYNDAYNHIVPWLVRNGYEVAVQK